MGESSLCSSGNLLTSIKNFEIIVSETSIFTGLLKYIQLMANRISKIESAFNNERTKVFKRFCMFERLIKVMGITQETQVLRHFIFSVNQSAIDGLSILRNNLPPLMDYSILQSILKDIQNIVRYRDECHMSLKRYLVPILENELRELDDCLLVGSKQCCLWNCKEFLSDRLNPSFDRLRQLLEFWRSNESLIENILTEARELRLTFSQSRVLTLTEFTLSLKTQMDALSGRLAWYLDAISSQMLRLEWEIFKTKTGKHEKMTLLYVEVEKRFLRTLIELFERNVYNLVRELKSSKPFVVINVEKEILNDELIKSSLFHGVFKAVTFIARVFLDGLSQIPRWQHQSCISIGQCFESSGGKLNKKVFYSYVSDFAIHKQVSGVLRVLEEVAVDLCVCLSSELLPLSDFLSKRSLGYLRSIESPNTDNVSLLRRYNLVINEFIRERQTIVRNRSYPPFSITFDTKDFYSAYLKKCEPLYHSLPSILTKISIPLLSDAENWIHRLKQAANRFVQDEVHDLYTLIEVIPLLQYHSEFESISVIISEMKNACDLTKSEINAAYELDKLNDRIQYVAQTVEKINRGAIVDQANEINKRISRYMRFLRYEYNLLNDEIDRCLRTHITLPMDLDQFTYTQLKQYEKTIREICSNAVYARQLSLDLSSGIKINFDIKNVLEIFKNRMNALRLLKVICKLSFPKTKLKREPWYVWSKAQANSQFKFIFEEIANLAENMGHENASISDCMRAVADRCYDMISALEMVDWLAEERVRLSDEHFGLLRENLSLNHDFSYCDLWRHGHSATDFSYVRSKLAMVSRKIEFKKVANDITDRINSQRIFTENKDRRVLLNLNEVLTELEKERDLIVKFIDDTNNDEFSKMIIDSLENVIGLNKKLRMVIDAQAWITLFNQILKSNNVSIKESISDVFDDIVAAFDNLIENEIEHSTTDVGVEYIPMSRFTVSAMIDQRLTEISEKNDSNFKIETYEILIGQFPRYSLVRDYIEALGQVKDWISGKENKVPLIDQMFEGAKELIIDQNGSIKGIVSKTGEELLFLNPKVVENATHLDLLRNVEQEISVALRTNFKHNLSVLCKIWNDCESFELDGLTSRGLSLAMRTIWTCEVEKLVADKNRSGLITMRDKLVVLFSHFRQFQSFEMSLANLECATSLLLQEKEQDWEFVFNRLLKHYYLRDSFVVECGDMVLDYRFEYYGDNSDYEGILFTDQAMYTCATILESWSMGYGCCVLNNHEYTSLIIRLMARLCGRVYVNCCEDSLKSARCRMRGCGLVDGFCVISEASEAGNVIFGIERTTVPTNLMVLNHVNTSRFLSILRPVRIEFGHFKTRAIEFGNLCSSKHFQVFKNNLLTQPFKTFEYCLMKDRYILEKTENRIANMISEFLSFKRIDNHRFSSLLHSLCEAIVLTKKVAVRGSVKTGKSLLITLALNALEMQEIRVSSSEVVDTTDANEQFIYVVDAYSFPPIDHEYVVYETVAQVTNPDLKEIFIDEVTYSDIQRNLIDPQTHCNDSTWKILSQCIPLIHKTTKSVPLLVIMKSIANLIGIWRNDDQSIDGVIAVAIANAFAPFADTSVDIELHRFFKEKIPFDSVHDYRFLNNNWIRWSDTFQDSEILLIKEHQGFLEHTVIPLLRTNIDVTLICNDWLDLKDLSEYLSLKLERDVPIFNPYRKDILMNCPYVILDGTLDYSYTELKNYIESHNKTTTFLTIVRNLESSDIKKYRFLTSGVLLKIPGISRQNFMDYLVRKYFNSNKMGCRALVSASVHLLSRLPDRYQKTIRVDLQNLLLRCQIIDFNADVTKILKDWEVIVKKVLSPRSDNNADITSLVSDSVTNLSIISKDRRTSGPKKKRKVKKRKAKKRKAKKRKPIKNKTKRKKKITKTMVGKSENAKPYKRKKKVRKAKKKLLKKNKRRLKKNKKIKRQNRSKLLTIVDPFNEKVKTYLKLHENSLPLFYLADTDEKLTRILENMHLHRNILIVAKRGAGCEAHMRLAALIAGYEFISKSDKFQNPHALMYIDEDDLSEYSEHIKMHLHDCNHYRKILASRMEGNIVKEVDTECPVIVVRCQNYEEFRQRCMRDNLGEILANLFAMKLSIPKDAILSQFVSKYLPDIDFSTGKTLVRIHEYIRRKLPDRFIGFREFQRFISLFNSILSTQKQLIIGRSQKLDKALEKIKQIRGEVEELQRGVKVEKTNLGKQEAHFKRLSKEIEKVKVAQRAKRSAMEETREEIDKQNFLIDVERKRAVQILNDALPLLEAARQSLEKLKNEHIAEMSSFPDPAKAVVYVGYCILSYMGVKTVNWPAVKRTMLGPNFMNDLKTRRPEEVKAKDVRELDKWLGKLKANIKIEKLDDEGDPTDEEFVNAMKRKSFAGSELLSFMLSARKYLTAYEEIRPKEKVVAELEKKAKAGELQFKELQGVVAKFEKHLQQLEEMQSMANKRLVKVREKAQMTEEHAQVCERLLTEEQRITIGERFYDDLINNDDRIPEWTVNGLPQRKSQLEYALLIFSELPNDIPRILVRPSNTLINWFRSMGRSEQMIEIDASDPECELKMHDALKNTQNLMLNNWTFDSKVDCLSEYVKLNVKPSFPILIITEDSFTCAFKRAKKLKRFICIDCEDDNKKEQLMSILTGMRLFMNLESGEKREDILDTMAKRKMVEHVLLIELSSAEGDFLNNRGLLNNLERNVAEESKFTEAIEAAQGMIYSAPYRKMTDSLEKVADCTLFAINLIGRLKDINNAYEFSTDELISVVDAAIDDIAGDTTDPYSMTSSMMETIAVFLFQRCAMVMFNEVHQLILQFILCVGIQIFRTNIDENSVLKFLRQEKVNTETNHEFNRFVNNMQNLNNRSVSVMKDYIDKTLGEIFFVQESFSIERLFTSETKASVGIAVLGCKDASTLVNQLKPIARMYTSLELSIISTDSDAEFKLKLKECYSRGQWVLFDGEKLSNRMVVYVREIMRTEIEQRNSFRIWMIFNVSVLSSSQRRLVLECLKIAQCNLSEGSAQQRSIGENLRMAQKSTHEVLCLLQQANVLPSPWKYGKNEFEYFADIIENGESLSVLKERLTAVYTQIGPFSKSVVQQWINIYFDRKTFNGPRADQDVSDAIYGLCEEEMSKQLNKSLAMLKDIDINEILMFIEDFEVNLPEFGNMEYPDFMANEVILFQQNVLQVREFLKKKKDCANHVLACDDLKHFWIHNICGSEDDEIFEGLAMFEWQKMCHKRVKMIKEKMVNLGLFINPRKFVYNHFKKEEFEILELMIAGIGDGNGLTFSGSLIKGATFDRNFVLHPLEMSAESWFNECPDLSLKLIEGSLKSTTIRVPVYHRSTLNDFTEDPLFFVYCDYERHSQSILRRSGAAFVLRK
ncbi:hypothetical protein ACOME3_002140 [Neoechinorhynchus agilis]